jgi:CubicO group peptidase (beta-lactamase class C family)
MAKLYFLTGIVLFLLSCSKEDVNTQPELSSYFPPLSSANWETTEPQKLGWNTSEIPELLTLLEEKGTRAFIILIDGKIVLESYFGNNILGTKAFDRSSYWYWASAGKTLTATLAGIAQQKGYLNINDKTSDYLGPQWTSLSTEQENKITIKHQLTMTTGLDDGVADNHAFEPENLTFKADPGTRWAYHNAPYTLLDKVIESATSKTFSTFYKETVGDQIGMDGFWQWLNNDHVFFSTPRSMARFGHLILNKGKWNQETIFDYDAYFTQMVSKSQEINKSYGYLWWLNGKESFMVPGLQVTFTGSITPNAPSDMYSGLGKNGQFLCVIPSRKMVLVRLGESPDNALVPILFLDEIWDQLNKIVP